MRRPLRRALLTTCFSSVLLAASALAQSQSPQNLPVVFESDDARDGSYEAATQALFDLHVQQGVPLAQLTVPCGVGSTVSPYSCVNNSGFHNRYRDWVSQHPDLIEIGHHGVTHTEQWGTMTFSQQLDLMTRTLQEMESWGLPQRPYAFAPPFASENTDTIAVLEQLGYHTSIRNSDTCLPSSSMDGWCESVSLCARDASGNRVQGPSCVFLSPSTLIQQVNDRQFDGKVFLVYHVQDVLKSDLVTVDPAKMSQLQAILQAFRAEQSAGHYRLMTFDTYYRTVRGVPTPTPLPGTDRVVYEESLLAPWINASWGSTVNFANTSPVGSGTKSIRIDEVGWGGFSVHSGQWGSAIPLDPARYQSLDMQVFSSTPGFQMIVRLENDAGNTFPAVNAGTIPANQWVSISVSMSQLNPQNLSFDRFDTFDANGTSRTYYLDGIRFVGVGGSTPPPTATPRPPTPTPPPAATATPTRTPTQGPTPAATPTPAAGGITIFSDALASPWIDVSWSSTRNFGNTSPVFSGTRSIRVDTTNWGALSLHNGSWTATKPLNPANYQAVEFQVFPTTAGMKAYVQLENDAKASFPAIAFGTVPANQWTRVSIPISQLDPSGTQFDRVDLGDMTGTSRTFYVDDLKLVPR